MKVLIAGGGAFCAQLIARLNRERHDVYIIQSREMRQPERSEAQADGHYTEYFFDLDDLSLDFIISSIKPDVIIFLGSLNENYDWGIYHKSSAVLLSGLSNMLCIAASKQVSRFIYVSTTEVYGTKYNRRLHEVLDAAPENVKNLVIAQGEDLCMGFCSVTGLQTISLRFSSIYGLVSEERDDFASKLFYTATNSNSDTVVVSSEDMEFSPIFISDAIDAIYKAAVSGGVKTGIFNVAGPVTTLQSVCYEISKLTGNSISISGQSTGRVAIFSVDFGKFAESFGFKPIVSIKDGLSRLNKALIKYKKERKKENNRKRKKTKILPLLLPFVENILLFAAAVALLYFTTGNIYLEKIDFFIFYILIISITFGVLQSTISIVLACSFLIWQSLGQGQSAIDFVTGLDILLKVLQYFIIGALCGYRTDRMKTKMDEKDQQLNDSEQELESIYDINDKNMRIKQVLDSRLTNYENSLAKIYSVTDQLNSLQTDEVFFSAINAVSEIMNSNDVSIYIVTGQTQQMCRLVAKSPKTDRNLRKSIPLADFGELAECMERDDIYINRNLRADMPIMAAPIFSARSLVSIIMLWTVEFEDLTVYNINNFLVLSKLISSIIEKAYVHSQATSAVNHLQNSGVLKPEAYMNILKVYEQAAKDGVAQHHVFELDISVPNIDEVILKVSKLLRNTDYMGWHSNGTFQILLTNTSAEDSKFVYERFQRESILVKEIV